MALRAARLLAQQVSVSSQVLLPPAAAVLSSTCSASISSQPFVRNGQLLNQLLVSGLAWSPGMNAWQLGCAAFRLCGCCVPLLIPAAAILDATKLSTGAYQPGVTLSLLSGLGSVGSQGGTELCLAERNRSPEGPACVHCSSTAWCTVSSPTCTVFQCA